MNNSQSGRRGFFSQLSKSPFIRKESRWFGGVATGIADYFKIDVILARGIVVVLSFLGGLGLILYGLAWALLPDEQGRIHFERALKKDWTSGMTGATLVVFLGIFPAQWILDSVTPVVWPLAIAAAILFIIFSRKNTKFAKPRPYEPRTAKSSTSSPGHTTAMEKTWHQDAQSFSSNAAAGPSYDATAKETTQQEEAMAANDSEPKQAGYSYDYSYSTDSAKTHPYTYDGSKQKPARKAPLAEPIPGWLSTTVIGVVILVIAAVLCADYLNLVQLPGAGWGVAWAAGLLVTGLAIVLAAIAGRTTGGLHGVAVPLLVLTLVFSGSNFGTSERNVVRSETSSNEYSAVFSKSDVDLTYLNSITTPTTVKVDSVFSRLDLKLPADVPVRIVNDGVFNSHMDGELPQDDRNFPADAPVLTIEIDGLFSAYDTEVVSSNSSAKTTTEF